jgi:DinB superfamily
MGIWYAALVVAWGLAQPAPPEKEMDLIGYLQAGYAGTKADLTSAAEAMPEADYGFKPTSMPEVRTFGETIAHVASAQFNLCARLRGVPDESAKVPPTTKTEVLKVLAASFTSCDAALASITDASSGEFVRQGPVEIPKTAALVGLLAHNAERYGIATVYLRARNIVPPSTARQKGNR